MSLLVFRIIVKDRCMDLVFLVYILLAHCNGFCAPINHGPRFTFNIFLDFQQVGKRKMDIVLNECQDTGYST